MITTLQFKTLDDLYLFYNEHIFSGQLPECIVNMSRKGGSYGFFAPERWKGENVEKKIIHEIVLILTSWIDPIKIGIPRSCMRCAICGKRISASLAETTIIISNGPLR